MLEAVLDEYPMQEQEINDLSSAVFNTFLGIGQISGPLFGSYMTVEHGFRLTSDYVALICIAFACVYFFCGSGASGFAMSRCRRDPIRHVFEGELVIPLNRSRSIARSNESVIRSRLHSHASMDLAHSYQRSYIKP